jgi:hypothetical protein
LRAASPFSSCARRPAVETAIAAARPEATNNERREKPIGDVGVMAISRADGAPFVNGT